ncbi:hypothetical protein ACKWTF_014008 [Chironomus riparius]
MSCTVSSKTNIMRRETKVTSICGGSTAGIKVFYALSKVIRYIPKNLKVVFKDLTGFRLENTQLKMVTKEDLEPFPDLLMFASVSNHIEFLEEDLFIFNTKLQYVSFRANKISFIHPTVFANVKLTLKQLYMDAQAINCGIGNPTTPAAIENALIKFEFSQCADILNAPALYSLWLELKGQVSGGSEELETCQADLATATTDLDAAKTELDTAKTELDTATTELATAKQEAADCSSELEAAKTACEGTGATLEEITGMLAGCCAGDATAKNCIAL